MNAVTSPSRPRVAASIEIKKAGNEYRLFTEIELPAPRSEVFDFFSKASNLELLTPAFVNFKILTPLPIEMRSGAKIDYRIRLKGIPIRWRTNICVWEPEERFVDEQIRGPYRKWHHEHVFIDQGDTTLMKDIVHYRVWLSSIFHPLMVKRDLLRIFEYRQRKILELFSA